METGLSGSLVVVASFWLIRLLSPDLVCRVALEGVDTCDCRQRVLEKLTQIHFFSKPSRDGPFSFRAIGESFADKIAPHEITRSHTRRHETARKMLHEVRAV